MEAGENQIHVPTYYLNLFSSFLEFSHLCHTLGSISITTYEEAEINLIENILNVVHSNAKTALLIANRTDGLAPGNLYSLIDSTGLLRQYNNLLNAHTKIWELLTYRHRSTLIRELLHKYLIVLVSVINKAYTKLYPTCQKSFNTPKITNAPSAHSQIVTNPSKIIDPYKLSLQSNYYYPLLQMTPLPDDDELQQEVKDDPKSPSANSPSPAKKLAMITVESSIEILTDLLENMEEDDLPVQSQPTEQALEQEAQTKPSYYKHRFSIYRKSFSTTYPAATLSQLTLFKTFCKCLKSIDNQIQILPLRNDKKINPLTTTDQINHPEEIGIPNYFRAYKRTKKMLSGDFYIGTKYTFEELIANSNLLT
jgi:hypothetical protein